MSLKILNPKEQAFGLYDNGNVRERKPVATPNDEGGFAGYSNLYYWACTFSKEGGEVEDHSHKGFEILTYVMEGTLEIFDPEKETWSRLEAGDLQLLRAGNGFNQSEKFHPGTKTFQIWLDPDLRLSLQKDPMYLDFTRDEFELSTSKGVTICDFTGEDSDLILSTPCRMVRIDLEPGSTFKDGSSKEIISAYVISGKISIDGQELGKGDFFVVKDRKELVLKGEEKASVLYLANPSKPGYRTYIDQLQLQA